MDMIPEEQIFMKILNLSTNDINQNGYNFNQLTLDKIGFIFTAPIKFTPNDCLACDGYVLKKVDYKKLYTVIGSTFNTGEEADDEFRIPDYNISGHFLQPSQNVAIKRVAGLPDITGAIHFSGIDGWAASETAFYHSLASGAGRSHNSGSGSCDVWFRFAASRSSAIYGKSTTVQPPSHTVHLCIKYK